MRERFFFRSQVRKATEKRDQRKGLKSIAVPSRVKFLFRLFDNVRFFSCLADVQRAYRRSYALSPTQYFFPIAFKGMWRPTAPSPTPPRRQGNMQSRDIRAHTQQQEKEAS